MSNTLQRIRELARGREVQISEHGYDEMQAEDISINDVVTGVENAVVIEDYPNYYKGPSVLVLEYDANEFPIHVVWGIPKGAESPAVVVTAYRPDPTRWSEDFLRRET